LILGKRYFFRENENSPFKRGDYVRVKEGCRERFEPNIVDNYSYFVYGFTEDRHRTDIMLTHLIDPRLLDLSYFEHCEGIRNLGRELSSVAYDERNKAKANRLSAMRPNPNYSKYIYEKVIKDIDPQTTTKSPLYTFLYPLEDALEILELCSEQEAMKWANCKEEKLKRYLDETLLC